jgi:transmembrane sensor
VTGRAHSETIGDRLLETAAGWRMRAQADGGNESLEAWLAADPSHRAAFEQIDQAWAVFDEDGADAPLLADTMRDVRARVAEAPRKRVWKMADWASGLAASIALVLVALPLLDMQRYRSQPGEERTITLADGSTLTLDGDSRVRVRYGKSARELWLDQGQARFDVAHDRSRPFSVHAGDRTVVATGTAFNIELLAHRTIVSLIEGHVLIHPAPDLLDTVPSAKTVTLQAGQQLVSAPARPPVVATADMTDVTAWQDGRLIFTDEPLADAIVQVNRHAHRHVALDDPAVGAMRISGVFKIADADRFGEAVAGYLPVRIVSADEQNSVLGAR